MTAATGASLEALVKAQAYGLGFDLVGITTPSRARNADAFERWVEQGRAGEMVYMTRDVTRRGDTRVAVPMAESVIVVGMSYGGREPSGPVARYARGDDYHDVMIEQLRALHAWLSSHLGLEVAGKAYVDTGPILERDLAQRAGLGWVGKNTNLISPGVGSFFFLGSLFVDLKLAPDAPFEADRCGSCRRCLDACPTGAFVEERVLDAQRCISYLTIELKGPIPEELREPIGELIYGCDICQDACPWNVRFARDLPVDSPYAARDAIAGKDARTLARDLLGMTQEEFSASFSGSPMKRAKLRGLKRNAAIVLGNVGTVEDVEVLAHATVDPEPLVRAHAERSLERVRSRA
jgi:epoxyqueuosine reductase